MASYFERRKKPPLRHALSCRPYGPFLIHHAIRFDIPSPFSTLDQKASNTLTVEPDY